MSGTLAYNMRPQSLSDILGQEHITGENGLFTKFVEKNHINKAKIKSAFFISWS